MKVRGILIAILVVCVSSCKTLLPEGGQRGVSKWASYQAAESTFSQIKPSITTVVELKGLGINLKTTPNLKKLTYLDVMSRFNLDSSVFNNVKLPEGVKEALNRHNNCVGYEMTISSYTNKRVGSFWKDVLGFQQVTQTRGWEFTGLLIVVDDIVVYVLTSGEARVEKVNTESKPLGPFQNISGGDLMGIAEKL